MAEGLDVKPEGGVFGLDSLSRKTLVGEAGEGGDDHARLGGVRTVERQKAASRS